MVLLRGLPVSGGDSSSMLRAQLVVSVPDPQPNRTFVLERSTRQLSQSKAFASMSTVHFDPILAGYICIAFIAVVPLAMMFQPANTGQNNMRMPPRWDPSMESTLPFRTWVQDLMLWTICTDMEPHQQCAAIISQLGGPARELARTITPQEVYQGGMVNGRQVDPVTFLLHGLSRRFAPLDEETRLRAAQDLLAFSRRPGESVDALMSRFEITRARARTEGGGAVSVETATLILLRACGVNSEQFQALTQPFGLRMPATEQEYSQMCHHLRRMGHIVERHPNNIASGLRTQHHGPQTYLAEADTGSSVSDGNQWGSADWAQSAGSGWPSGTSTDWAFAATAAEGGSETDSCTSSDNDEPLDVSDLQGLSSAAADEYLFGEYQHAKRRWRRFSGKPVRSLRKVIRRKGKGKGKNRSYVNLGDLLQQSSYFKGKGKGGQSSGKGFGRKQNPKGRDGEIMKCSTCGSMYHLRARCPRRPTEGATASSSGLPASSQPARAGPPTFTVETTAEATSGHGSSGLHFATFESDGSWSHVQTPRSTASTYAQQAPRQAGQPEVEVQGTEGDVEAASAQSVDNASQLVQHELSPDPWLTQPDPWMQWMHDTGHPAATTSAQASATPYNTTVQQGSTLSTSPLMTNSWWAPGVGNVGAQESFAQALDFERYPPPPVNPAFTTSGPAWFAGVQQAFSTVHQAASQSEPRRHSQSRRPQAPRSVPMLFSSGSGTQDLQHDVPSPFLIQGSGSQEIPMSTLNMFSPVNPSVGAMPPAAPSALLPVPESSLGPVSLFSQVHALRGARSDAQARSSPTEPAAPATAAATPGRVHVRPTACSVCLEEFAPGDHMCRLTCAHTFHAVCLGEMAMQMGAEFDEQGQMAVCCPLCRAQSQLMRSWRYPALSTEQPADDARPEVSSETGGSPEHAQRAPATPESSGATLEEFHTPESAAYPWWPVADHNSSESQAAATGSHANSASSFRILPHVGKIK